MEREGGADGVPAPPRLSEEQDEIEDPLPPAGYYERRSLTKEELDAVAEGDARLGALRNRSDAVRELKRLSKGVCQVFKVVEG